MAKTRKQKKGGAILGKGKSGTAYYPALNCSDPSQQPKGDLVSKVLSNTKHATNDFRISRLILEKGYDFVCPTVDACRKKPDNPYNRSWLVFSLYCGVPLKKAAETIIENNSLSEYMHFINALQVLRSNIQKMNNDFVYHNDIASSNIVYDFTTKKAFLIDFERASVGTEEDKEASDILFFDGIFDYYDSFFKSAYA
jgi:serine/threonine protein kinase